NVPKVSLSGRMHQSTAEATHANELLALEQAGKITDVRGLQRSDSQEEVVLAVYATKEVELLLQGIELLLLEPGRAPGENWLPEIARRCRDVRQSLIKICRYRADFTFTDEKGNRIVQDVKGVRTAMFRVKKALMLAAHGIEVEEIDARQYRHRRRIG